jgi:hypothetical protein
MKIHAWDAQRRLEAREIVSGKQLGNPRFF